MTFSESRTAGSIQATVAAVEAELKAAGDPERAVQERRYLKSELEFYGASLPVIRGVAKRVAVADRGELVALVAALWARPVHELRGTAVELLDRHGDLLEVEDFPLLERLLRESHTWAYVDAISVHVVGALVERQPAAARVLDRWARDPDFWLRRAAMLALLLPLRRGGGDFDRFARYADAMLEEREFFIRKAIGWVLREVAKKRPQLVSDWLRPRVHRAAGLTVREAVRYLPAAQGAELLAALRRPRGR